MWLTKGGVESRQQFLTWACALGQRIHIPVWTYHEYYRHHSRDTLRANLALEAKNLKDAARRYVEIAQTYADDPFKSGLSADAYHRELEELLSKVKEVTETAERWDYDAAATQMRDWMSERLCRSKAVFELMDRLGQTGQTRYTQDVPPGFRDRRKEDSESHGSNKFGDLILWEEVIAHVSVVPAKTVVVLTRDRKEDWFARAGEPAIEDGLRRLRERLRWDPVPAPHPTLVLELSERTSATELLLLDSLYLGAVLHHIGEPNWARLVAYSLGIRSTAYVPAAPGAATPTARPPSVPLSMRAARDLCRALTIPPDQAAMSAGVKDIRARLGAALPEAEAFVNEFGQQQLEKLSVEDVAALARTVADEALSPHGYIAQQMSTKLLELLPSVAQDRASAIYAGMLTSAYYDASGPRLVPAAWDLQGLFDNLVDETYANVLRCIERDLKAMSSSALFIPTAGPTRLSMHFAHDARQEQVPLVLQQIALGDRNLLDDIGPAIPSNLTAILGGRNIATVADLRMVAAQHYGLPIWLIDVNGAELQDERTVPAAIGFISPEDTEGIAAAINVPSDAVLNAIPEGELKDLDEDELDAKAILDEESDE